MKIISGGQTGVDRAALDCALQNGVDCGGWCPAGRLDEIGRIPDEYPLTELPNGSFDDRTRANVRDADGSVMFYVNQVEGGTKYAVDCCRELNRPCLLVDAAKTNATAAADAMLRFIREHKIDIVGVGGPRASEWAEGYDYAFDVLNVFFARTTGATRNVAP